MRLLFILWTLKVLFQDILNTCFYIPINDNVCELVLKMFVARSKLDETIFLSLFVLLEYVLMLMTSTTETYF